MTPNKTYSRIALLALLFFALFTPVKSFGQGITTGSISGVVVDSQGAVIPKAQIEITNTETGIVSHVISGDHGNYSVHQLPSGSYNVVTRMDGFASTKVENVTVNAGVDVDLGEQKLAAGAADVVLVMSGSQIMLQTEQSQSQATIEGKEVEQLAQSGKLDNLVAFQPGVVKAHDASGGASGNGDNYSINGQRAVSNNFEIDGQANNDNSYTGPMILFNNQDAVKEVQVITSSFSAQYGRNMGGVVNYITKTGSNSIHGSAYEFFTGSFLSAINNQAKSTLLGYCGLGVASGTGGCKSATVTRFVDNRWGGTVGGPILKDRLWFFGGTNWEHVRKGANPDTSSSFTPTPAGIATLSAALPGNIGVGILKNSGPFANPAGNPAAVNARLQSVTVTGGITIPNVQFAQITRALPQQFNDQQHIGRIDWQATSKDRFFLRYIYQNDLSTNTGTFNNNAYYSVPRTVHSVGGDWTRVMTPNVVNQVRYSFQQSKVGQNNYGGVASCTAQTQDACQTYIAIAGSPTFGSSVALAARVQKVTQIQDNVTYAHGRHTISVGGDFTYTNAPSFFLSYYQGGFAFASIGDYLAGGVPNSTSFTLASGSPIVPYKEADFSLYAQDDYKILPSLTLNLGLRYEFYGQALNYFHNLTVARESNPATALWSASLPLSEKTYPYTAPNYKNFAPRIGFAFNPASMRSLVVRGAFSIQYDPSFYSMLNNTVASAPITNVGTITNCSAAAPCLTADNTAASTRALNLPKIPLGADPRTRNITNNPPNFRNPYTETYLLGVQYQVSHAATVYVGYAGNHTLENFQSINGNPYITDLAAAFPTQFGGLTRCTDSTAIGFGRTNCNYRYIRQRANTGFSNYNSLQTQIRTSSWHGITAFGNYTFSKIMSNSEGVQNIVTGAGGYVSMWAQNPFNDQRGEYAVSNLNMPNVVSIGAVLETPKVSSGSSLVRKLLNGYSVTPQYFFNSGQPWTPYQPTSYATLSAATIGVVNSQSYCDNGFSVSIITWDACRPVELNRNAPNTAVGVYVVDPSQTFTTNGTGYYAYATTSGGKLSSPQTASSLHWIYNNRAYANLVNNPYPGIGRNPAKGQSYNDLDLSVSKSTPVREGIGLTLYANAFNIMNRRFLGTPVTSIVDPNFGTNQLNSGVYGGNTGNGSSSSVPASRYVQLGGKISF